MTKKHYEAIADIMYRYSHHPEWIAEKLADYFATDNKNFDRNRFLAACGIETPEMWLEKDRYERRHRKIQNWGEQHPEFHTKEHMQWLKTKQ